MSIIYSEWQEKRIRYLEKKVVLLQELVNGGKKQLIESKLYNLERKARCQK